MIKVHEALKAILKDAKALPSETIQLTSSLGRVLAEDIHAGSDIPAFDNSAMDGYALRSHDSSGACKDKPITLEVIEDLRAGYISHSKVKKGQAVRIMTGAPMPEGSDSVVMVEETKRHKNSVEIFREIRKLENVRKAGEDIKQGELVLHRGTLLKSAHIGILAALGMPKVNVARRARIAILATGDEVVDVDEKLEPGKLRSSNTYTLYSQALNCGAIPKNLGIAKDKPHELEKKIRQGLDCDLILTSGGVSVGDYDLVKFILAKMGTNIKFWQVAMRPGKPLVFGSIKGIPIFGLPGNPVSSMVSFEVFVRPLLLKMSGQATDERKDLDAVLEEDIKKKRGLRYFLRARTRWEDGIYLTTTTGPQGSAILKSMAQANSLIILPEEEEFIEKGTRVTVRFLE